MDRIVDDGAYRALFDANPCPMWVFDREMLRFLAVNDAAVRQYGYPREEFLQLTILDIRPVEDADLVRGSIVSHLSEAQVWNHRRKDGSTLLAEVTAHDITFLGSEARLVLALDVSVRERNADLLKKSNNTLEAVLQAAPVGMIVVRPDGKVGQSNVEARRILGEGGLAPLQNAVQAALRGEAYAGGEVPLEDGRWVDVSSSAVELGLASNGAVITLVDVTDRRHDIGRLSQDLVERTAALQASDAELDGFAFSVSHDLRGPLRAVDGFAQMVLTDPEAKLSDENRDALERVRRAGQRMSVLIDGLLMLSRLTRAPLELQQVNLSEIVQRLSNNFAKAHPDRKFQFVITPDATIYGDPGLLTALVEHLLANAIKFTGTREEAKIEFLALDDGWAIRDNGVGFNPEYSPRLFKPFERLHTVHEFPGNGLGLAVAHRIVRRHGGTIEAWGEPNRGATFKFTLPTPKTT